MYFNAPAFFVVYHTLAVIVMRRVRTLPAADSLRPLLTVVTVVLVAYSMAFLETRLVATDANSESFCYKDLAAMLKYGSLFYACYFFASFPMVYRLDEKADENWPVSKVLIEALAAGMMAMFLVDFATHYVGDNLIAEGLSCP
jgi:cycloeucalenol cycloisomerase